MTRNTRSQIGTTAILSFALASACGPPAAEAPAPARLTLDDVSILFPLPEEGTGNAGLLGPLDEGARGVLLPRETYDEIPTFPVTPREGLDYDAMRVVAARFDGCGGQPAACLPELRLVMQPLDEDGSTRDSALHLFYRLDAAEMAPTVTELRRLRTLAPEVTEGPLDVHPSLVAQGLTGPYGAGLRALILARAGASNLVRMTFFLRAPPIQDVWFFGGFEREVDGTVRAMDIVGVGTSNQRVILTEDSGYAYDLTPNPTTPEDGAALLSTAAAAAASDEVRRAAFASYLRVENPARHAPDALPCAGCHLADVVVAHAGASLGLTPSAFPADAYTSSRDLSRRGASGTTPRSLRAFGWFDRDPMIAQRVINDSAAVADDLELRYPAPR